MVIEGARWPQRMNQGNRREAFWYHYIERDYYKFMPNIVVKGETPKSNEAAHPLSEKNKAKALLLDQKW